MEKLELEILEGIASVFSANKGIVFIYDPKSGTTNLTVKNLSKSMVLGVFANAMQEVGKK